MSTLNCPDDELVLRYQGFVRSVAVTAWKATLGDIDLEDLISYGQVGLVQAARSYDPTSGLEFSTYAFYRVRGAIFDGYASMQWLSRAQYKRICRMRLMDEAIQRHEQVAGNVAGGDCPDHAAWSAGVIGKLFVVHLALEAGEGGQLASQVEDRMAASPSEALELAEVQVAIRHAVDDLPIEERALVKSVYFDGQTLTDAAKALGKSKSWASRLHDRALQRLLRKLQTAGLAGAAH